MEEELNNAVEDGQLLSAGLEEAKPLSKRQQKLMKRKQEWLEQKEQRRSEKKEKRKEKRRQKVESGVDLGPSRKLLKKNTMELSKCRVSVAIDLSFDGLMNEKDINKLCQQIQYCYSRNRRASEPLQLYLTSLSEKTQERLRKVGDYKNWDIHIRSDSHSEVFDSARVVYLTSESSNVLETLEPDKVYVIGGLVDHNHHKGHCHDLAVRGGLSHARLPIDEYCKMNSRKVLTINHVFEILLHFTETNNWQESFYKVIPKRKQAKTSNGDDSQSEFESDSANSDDPNVVACCDTVTSAIFPSTVNHNCDENKLTDEDGHKKNEETHVIKCEGVDSSSCKDGAAIENSSLLTNDCSSASVR